MTRPREMKRMELDQNDGYLIGVPVTAKTVRIELDAPVPGGIHPGPDGKPRVAGPFAPVPTFADYVVHHFSATDSWAVVEPVLYQRLGKKDLL